MSFDTYSNCSFGCVYCFSQYQRGIGKAKDAYFGKEVKSVNPEKVKAIFRGEVPNSQFNEYIRQRRVMQWGGLSDEFDEYERKFGVTLDLMRFFREECDDYPISFSTKGVWFLDDPRYREVLDGAPWNCKFSIITMNEWKAKTIEVRVPTPKQRLDAIEKWSDLCTGGATLRLRPFIPGVSDDYEELIRAAYNKGATAVSTEFFCMEERSKNIAKEHFKTLSMCAGFDLMAYYKRHSESSGYMRLNRKVKEPTFRHMKEICDELGMRLYISDAHFKELSHGACCCGLPESWNYSRGHFSEALQICKRNGVVYWSDIEPEMSFLDFPWKRAECYNTGGAEKRAKFQGLSMKEYLRYIWNNPTQGQNPYVMFGGVMYPDGQDENGDVIYRYDPTKTIM